MTSANIFTIMSRLADSNSQSSHLYTDNDRELRLFFSADLVGATAFKERHAGHAHTRALWTEYFDSFFRDFSRNFSSDLDQVVQLGREPTARPAPWKILGDELLWTAEIKNAADAACLMHGFCRTIYAFDADVQEIGKPRVKGAAWLAGFPIRNYQVRSIQIEGQRQDFIGPDIDAGFRLKEASRAGRVVVSMDLADVLTRNGSLAAAFDIRHVGWQDLKGVFGDKPYPVFWVCERDRQSPHQSPWVKDLCPLTRKADETDATRKPDDIQNLCRQMREALPDLNLFKPYFERADMPPEHQQWWDQQETRARQSHAPEDLDVDDPFGPQDKEPQPEPVDDQIRKTNMTRALNSRRNNSKRQKKK